MRKTKAARAADGRGETAHSSGTPRRRGLLEPCVGKRRHVRVEAHGELDETVGGECAAAFAQAEPEIQQGRAESVQEDGVTGLPGAVPEDQVLAELGLRSHRREERRRDDEPVDDDRRTGLHGGLGRAGDRRELAASDAAQDLERRLVAVEALQGVADHLGLERDSRLVEPVPGPTICFAGSPRSAAAAALAGVVFPIPISPRTSTLGAGSRPFTAPRPAS